MKFTKPVMEVAQSAVKFPQSAVKFTKSAAKFKIYGGKQGCACSDFAAKIRAAKVKTGSLGFKFARLRLEASIAIYTTQRVNLALKFHSHRLRQSAAN